MLNRLTSSFTKSNMQIIDKKISSNIRPHIFQSVLATLTILLILMFLDVTAHIAIIAVLGSSAFLVFTRPRAYGSRPRPLIGGYIIGISVGALFFYLSQLPAMMSLPVSAETVFRIFAAMSVGGAIFAMVITNTVHAPAAGLSLGLVVTTWSYGDIIFVMCAVLFMAIMRRLLQPIMIDLI